MITKIRHGDGLERILWVVYKVCEDRILEQRKMNVAVNRFFTKQLDVLARHITGEPTACSFGERYCNKSDKIVCNVERHKCRDVEQASHLKASW